MSAMTNRTLPSAGKESRCRTAVLLALLLLAMTVAAHFPALQAGFIWDDDRYVTGNALLRSASGLREIWVRPSLFPQYYPMVLTSFWAEYRLWGLDPRPYHTANVVLHAVNACLVFFLLRTLAVPGAWLAAALFALHPVHVETVAWVTERKNLLSALFALSSLLAYCSFLGWSGLLAPDNPTGGNGKSRKRLYTLSLVLFLLALLSKTTACAMPAVLCLLHWRKAGRITKKDLLPLAPFFGSGVALGLVTVYMEKVSVGAKGAEWSFSFLERLLIAGRALWFYVSKLCWPAELVFSYPRWKIDAGLWWQYLFPLSAAAVIVLLWVQRRRWGRWPLTAVLIFAGTLLPALGFFDVYPMRYSFVADHFQYLASVGIIPLFPALLTRLFSGNHRGAPTTRALLACVFAPVLLLLAVLTWKQAQIYRDQETLWRDTIRKNPASWMASMNLGVLLIERGESGEAAALFRKVLELRPANATSLYGLGRIAAQEGRTEEAISLFRQSLTVLPDFIAPRFALATALARRGAVDEARSLFFEILRVRPDDTKVYTNLGALSAQQGAWNDALMYFSAALRLEPGSAKRHGNVGLALMNLGKLSDAEASYREAVRLDPGDAEAHTQLGAVLVRQGKLAEAGEHLSSALRIRPDHEAARALLREVRGTNPQ